MNKTTITAFLIGLAVGVAATAAFSTQAETCYLTATKQVCVK
jgi:hypothetical protein